MGKTRLAGAGAETGMETDFIDEAGEAVHDFTPGVSGVVVEGIPML